MLVTEVGNTYAGRIDTNIFVITWGPVVTAPFTDFPDDMKVITWENIPNYFVFVFSDLYADTTYLT